MNIKLVLKAIALVLLIVSGFMLLPIAVAFIYDEKNTIAAFLIPAVITAAICGFYLLFTKKQNARFSTRDGFLMVSFSWIFASLLGCIPFMLSGEIPSFYDAFFETASGFTTTGSSILPNIEALSKSMLFWRSLTHWLGGMGIIVLAVAILPMLGVNGLQLMRAEVPGPNVDKLTPRITRTARIFWLMYVGFTVAEVILLLFGGMDLYDALTHTFGTIATGGFSPEQESIAAFSSPYIHGVITVFMVLAGTNFVIHYLALTRSFKKIWQNSEFKAYVVIFILFLTLVSASLFGSGVYETIGESIQYGSFQVAALLTTTGYVTADYAAWPEFTKNLLFILFFIGGCAGSTGGGIKILHLVTIVKQSINEFRYLIHPRGVFNIRINGQRVKKSFIFSITGFVFFYITFVLISTVIVSLAGTDILSSLSASLAVIGNIGPGFGAVGPTENYALFPGPLKLWLSAAMILGRLEMYTILVIFSKDFWKS